MAFDQKTFAPVGANSTDTPKVFSYKTDDSFAVVSTTGYFDKKRLQLEPKDIIFANTQGTLHIISVTSSGATVSVSEQAAPANQKIINSLSEFPDESGGSIPLEADTFYLIGKNIPVSSVPWLLAADTVVAGLDSSVSSLSYSGAGTMFTSVDNSNKITLLTLDCPNGKLHDISNPGDGPNVFQFINCTVDSCDAVGDLDNMLAYQYTDVAFNDIKTDGISFAGTSVVFTGATDLATLNGASGSLFDLGTAVFDSFSLNASFITLTSGAVFLKGLTNSGNISENNSGSVLNVKTFGSGTPLSGISIDDIRWDFFGNDSIPDSRPDGFLSLTANATPTTLTQNIPTKILGTWVVERVSKFTGTTDGRLTYNGEKPITVPIIMTTTAAASSGSNKECAFFVYINGSQQANSKTRARLSANDVKSQTIIWQDVLVKDDFVELFVVNFTDSISILTEDAKSAVN